MGKLPSYCDDQEGEKANKQGAASKEHDGGDEEQGDEQLEIRGYANMPVQAPPVATTSLLPCGDDQEGGKGRQVHDGEAQE